MPARRSSRSSTTRKLPSSRSTSIGARRSSRTCSTIPAAPLPSNTAASELTAELALEQIAQGAEVRLFAHLGLVFLVRLALFLLRELGHQDFEDGALREMLAQLGAAWRSSLSGGEEAPRMAAGGAEDAHREAGLLDLDDLDLELLTAHHLLAFFGLLLGGWRRVECNAAVLGIDVVHEHPHDLSRLHHLACILDAGDAHVRDVAEALVAVGDLDERAEVLDSRDGAFHDGARLQVLGQLGEGILDQCLAAEPDLALLVDLLDANVDLLPRLE